MKSKVKLSLCYVFMVSNRCSEFNEISNGDILILDQGDRLKHTVIKYIHAEKTDFKFLRKNMLLVL